MAGGPGGELARASRLSKRNDKRGRSRERVSISPGVPVEKQYEFDTEGRQGAPSPSSFERALRSLLAYKPSCFGPDYTLGALPRLPPTWGDGLDGLASST